MKDPLTKTEKRALLKTFVQYWERTYQKVLTCGALKEAEKHDHRPAKYALICAAEGFRPLLEESKKELANLRHFI